MKSRRRRPIAVVTGSRAEYGLLRSTMEAVARHRQLRLRLVVAGMHLLRKFGRTIDEIIRDGWRVDARVKMQAGDDGPLDSALGLSRGVAGIARFLERSKIDIVVVLGDRVEAMAGALAGVTTGRLIAHIHGGDLAPGDFDDSLRHSITKLAHLHLAATRAARQRIIRMGEAPERAHVVGAPGLDRLKEIIENDCKSLTPKQAMVASRNPPTPLDKGGWGVAAQGVSEIGAEPPGRALIVQHPCGRTSRRERRTMEAILRAVEQKRLDRIIIYPNSDRGHTGIIEAIEAHRRRARNGSVRAIRSLDRDAYLRTLIEADVLVGNSSSGIIEAATAGTPAVNVGDRQQGRQRSGRCVLDAGETPESIGDALAKAMRKRPITGRTSVYGDGSAGARIAELLATQPLDDGFRRKRSVF